MRGGGGGGQIGQDLTPHHTIALKTVGQTLAQDFARWIIMYKDKHKHVNICIRPPIRAS